jgi:hypothetical protein
MDIGSSSTNAGQQPIAGGQVVTETISNQTTSIDIAPLSLAQFAGGYLASPTTDASIGWIGRAVS